VDAICGKSGGKFARTIHNGRIRRNRNSAWKIGPPKGKKCFKIDVASGGVCEDDSRAFLSWARSLSWSAVMDLTKSRLAKWLLASAFVFSITLASGCGNQDGTTPSLNLPSEGTSGARSAPAKPRFNAYPEIQVRTSAGEFTLKLDGKAAPLTMNHFLTNVNSGFYDGTIFHQAYDGFILLGGGYDAKMQPRPTQESVRNEAHNGLKNRRATIAMARQADAIDSARGEFFINLADNASLDHAGWEVNEYGYCVFGEVTAGMEVIDAIAKRPVHTVGGLENVPTDPVVIESIRRVK
jgi:cyclophilin family peptidyl-prolyl cis-trans isomerase